MKPSMLLLAVLAFLRVHATDPATSASNVQFTASGIDGGQFALSFTAGSGNGRIVVVKAGSDITGTPVDGTTYTPAGVNASTVTFATAGTGFTGAGEWVVARNTSTAGSAVSMTINGLTTGTTYYVAIFEYSTAGSPNPDYSNVTPVNKSVTTLVAPTTPAAISGMSQVAGNKARITFTNGNGQGRIIVGRKAASVSATPENYKYYNSNASFGLGTSSTYILDPETFVLVKATGTGSLAQSYDITNLEPNTQYTFAIYEYNGNNSPVYMNTGSSITFTTNAGPTQASNGVSSSTIDGNALGIYWDKGNGSQTIVVARKGSPVTNVPVNGQTYGYNASLSSGTEWVPGSQEYVVYRGTGNAVTVTGLDKASTYYFAVFVYDVDANGNTYYLTTLTNKPLTTALPPTAARTLSVGTITGNSAQLQYGNIVSGNGYYRLLVIRDGAPITFTPSDFTLYTDGGTNYGGGTPVATGTYVLYGKTNGGAPTVGNLTPGHTYYVACWDWNGANAPVYLVPGGSVSFTIPSEPTSGPTTPSFPTVEGNSLRFDWSPGTGARRIVVARKGAPVTTMPSDGVTYTPSTIMGSGTEMGNGLGEYVVFDNTGNSVTVSSLDPSSTYYFAVFEYNSTASGPDYLTSAGNWLSTSRATHSAPSQQVSAIGNGTLTTTTAVITFTAGNGSSRLFVLREGSPVNAVPANLQSYSGSLAFKSGSQLGTGNYAVAQGNTTSFTISNLQAGTQYYIAAFEFNGSSGPVYNTTSVAHSFTTPGSAPTPTQASSNPVFESVDGNRITFRWTSGTGAARIVVARKSLAPVFVPANGTAYPANAALGSGTNLSNETYIVYNGSSNTVNVTSLDPSSEYYFTVYEYNGSGSGIVYRTASILQTSGSTAMAPAGKSSAPGATATPTSLQLSWTPGTGTGRLVLAKAGSAPGAAPTDLTKYSGNSNFGDGPQLAAGEYIIYAGSGNSVTVTGLSNATTYHFKIIEYNGIDAPVYNTADFLAASAGTTGSVLPVSWLYVRGHEHAGTVRIEWATAQEQNTQHFVVERSSGNGFEAIGTVAAAGNSSSTREYTFTDLQPAGGLLHYRLRQVDSDGRFRYSATVQVRGKNGAQALLLQNPVQGNIALRCGAAGFYTIVDATGRSLARGTLQAGMQLIPASGMAPGRYFLRLQQRGEEPQTLSFILQ
ncbi:hypothetical protein EPD60_06315 [Flaviaesturariibacter flavus]|uniref:Fibronectin type-III domain-containing protein n=1 Tax=Flaviaesturariibacter flavus TaxID=2502780 RepID=A0A4R1BKE7_9BACT|nr:hypothetical protein [Flaviaesturariibacter flavus]TCJ17796.1 hypothetical protein EPD60_06315 [Flaviaesturariibacter flavus]